MLYGVGINDADYNITSIVNGKTVRCPYYTVWSNMLQRCYSISYLRNKPSYKGCRVTPEWLTFSKFKSWMIQQDWVNKELDKDLLIQGNKLYSPNTCVFIERKINGFLRDSAQTNKLPVGVYWRKDRNKFIAQCNDPFSGKNTRIGQFMCSNEAHRAWRERKHTLACMLADLQTNERVAEALRRRYSNDTNTNI